MEVELSERNNIFSVCFSDDIQRNEHRVIQITFDTFYHYLKKEKIQLSPLYPYDSTKIKLILFYGNDLRRVVVPPSFIDLASILKNWFLFVVFAFSILVLHLIRRIVSDQRIDIFSSTWIMYIIWIDGGDFQYNNKIEKFFISIMFFGAFFVKAFGIGSFNSDVVMQDSSGIDTFQKLAKIEDTPIFLNHVFQDRQEAVVKLLRSVEQFIT